MLYDKRWDKPEVKADPMSLDTLIAWLETMPAKKDYCYLDHGRCLLGQYFSAMGFGPEICVFSNGVLKHQGRESLYPDVFNRIALEAHPRTFGRALKLARSFQVRS